MGLDLNLATKRDQDKATARLPREARKATAEAARRPVVATEDRLPACKAG